MNRFDLSIKGVKDNMFDVTEYNLYWWSWLHWNEELDAATKDLKEADADDEIIGFYRWRVVQAKKLLAEMYEKMVQMPQFQAGWLPKPEWLDEFLGNQ